MWSVHKMKETAGVPSDRTGQNVKKKFNSWWQKALWRQFPKQQIVTSNTTSTEQR